MAESLPLPLTIHILPLQTGVFVEGAQCTTVKNSSDILAAISAGIARRQVASTGMNAQSSRSHSILTLDISSSCADDEDNTAGTLQARLNLVDLAGSESVRLTGAGGARLKEGGAINKSLLTLSRIINLRSTATSDSAFMPFRESKLTHLLEPSLSGRAKTAVVCCMSPSGAFAEESKSTLQFATSAKSIQAAPTRNEIVDDSTRIARLRREIVQLKAELAQSAAATLSSDDSGSDAPSAASSQQQRQHRLAQLMQEFICGGESPDATVVGGAATRGRTALGMARMARKGRARRDRETWCPSVGASAGALAAIEAFRAAPPSPEGPALPSLGSPAASCSNRSSLGGQSTMSTSTHGSSSTAGTEAEESSLQLELHRARAALAATRSELGALQAEAQQQLTQAHARISTLEADMAADAEDREEALEAALCRAEAAEGQLAALHAREHKAHEGQQAAAARTAHLESTVQQQQQQQLELRAQLHAAQKLASDTEEAARTSNMQLAEASSSHKRLQVQWGLDMESMRGQLYTAQAELAEEKKRCARLEQVKVTQELIDTLKGLKSDRKALRARVSDLTAQLAQSQSAGRDGADADAATATYQAQVASLQQMLSEKEEQLSAAESELSQQQQQATAAADSMVTLQAAVAELQASLHTKQKQHEALVSDIAGLVEIVRSSLPGVLEDSNVQLPVTVGGAASTVRVLGRILAGTLQDAVEAARKLQDATDRTVRLAQAVKTADAAAAAAAAREAEATAQLATVSTLQGELATLRDDLQASHSTLQAANQEATAAQAALQTAESEQVRLQEAAHCAEQRAASAQKAANAAKDALTAAQAEARRNAEFLEKENLQLMMELRTVRREAADGGFKGSTATTPARVPLTPSSGNVSTPSGKHDVLPPAAAIGAEEEQGECQQQ